MTQSQGAVTVHWSSFAARYGTLILSIFLLGQTLTKSPKNAYGPKPCHHLSSKALIATVQTKSNPLLTRIHGCHGNRFFMNSSARWIYKPSIVPACKEKSRSSLNSLLRLWFCRIDLTSFKNGRRSAISRRALSGQFEQDQTARARRSPANERAQERVQRVRWQ